jgi:hypothetical protein
VRALAYSTITDSSDPKQKNKTNSSYLGNLNLNENDDTKMDAEEIPCPRKKAFNII